MWINQLLQVFMLFFASVWIYIQLDWIYELYIYWILNQNRNQIKKLKYSFDINDELSNGIYEKKHDSNVLNYYGVDQNNNFLLIKINRRKDEYKELTLFLGLKDGAIYVLPGHPNSVLSDRKNCSWSTKNLKITILESSKRTRLIFNGLLRKGFCEDVHNDNYDNLKHVRLNCIFIASTRPCSRTEFWCSYLQAQTLVQNSCKLSKCQQIINEIDIQETHQYGSIIGKIIFEDVSSIELYLRGLRQCYWGKCDASQFETNICIVGIDCIGISFYINLSNMNNGLKNIRLGHVKDPIDNLHIINSIDFNIKKFLNCYNNGFDEYGFQFKAGNIKYQVIVKICRESKKIVYGGYPWDSQYKYYHFKMKLNNTSGVGLFQISQAYSNSCPIKLSLVKTCLGSQEYAESSLAYTIAFDDSSCLNKDIVGGKAASIAELTSIETTEFIIPKGFCITIHALESHIKYHTNLSEAIDLLVKICNGEKVGNLKEHSQQVVALIENTSIKHNIEIEILASLKLLELKSQENTYAIRSSAVGEDNEDTSAAGQNCTYLGIKGDRKVLKYVTHCWASLYSYRSIEYRRHNGLEIAARMGVCIQQMVDADVAGVMFTRHPLTGNPKEIYITSNYGLGETVVSALVDPDTIIIQRRSQKLLQVGSLIIGKKSQKISVKTNGYGTDTLAVSAEEMSKVSISLDAALKLAKIALILDELYNSPRDIEWALFHNKLYLLQCRPITSLNTWTDFELIHELGSGVPSDNDIFIFSNVGEVLPMVLTPLTLSSIVTSLNISTERNITRRPVLHTYTNHLFIFNMRCTLNYMNLLLRFVEKKVSQGIKVMEIAVCGRSIITPELHEMAKKRNGVLKMIELVRQRSNIVVDLFWNSKKVVYANEIVKQWRGTSIVKHISEYKYAQDIYTGIESLLKDFTEVSVCHSYTSKCSIFYQVLVMSILTEGSDDFTMEHYSDIAILLGSCSNVISAQVPITMKKISHAVRESGLSKEFKNLDSSEIMNWLSLNCPNAYNKVQEFINLHGHRGIEEFELITETWSMKPEKFLSIIQSMINSAEEDNISKDLSPGETVSCLKTPKKYLTRWILYFLLPAMRKAVAQRERTKALVIEMVHNLRLAYRRLAFLLTLNGRLPDQTLLFYLTHTELGELLERSSPGLLRKAARRAKIRLQLQSYKYSEINYGMLKPMKTMQESTKKGLSIQGTSVCNGIATGRACVAVTLEEATDVKSGDILITNSTDIGWSPFFPLLGGIVTELGGLISHGAVVAREYGLPCIVSAENATRKLKTGDIVTINGYTGTITINEEVEKAT